MRKIILLIMVMIFLSGCTKNQNVQPTTTPSLSVEQVDGYKKKVSALLSKKSWVPDINIKYVNVSIPLEVQNTYYWNILEKSKDIGYDFSKNLGKEAIEAIVNIKYSNGDVAGEGHFLFYQDKIIGAYYTVGNYIYSLNEKEVFKKNVNWGKTENLQKKSSFKDMKFTSAQNLVYWDKFNNQSYLYSWEDGKLKSLMAENGQFLVKSEISLEGLYLVDMFVKDIDKDKKGELALLVSNNSKWWEKEAKSKLIIYEAGDKLKQKYSLNFEQPMWSIDFDDKDIIATTENSVEMYGLEDGIFKKSYAYNKVGGIIKVVDIDGSGINRYILRDSSGTDIYVFERNVELEEIWRSYNDKSEYFGRVQAADLNGDGVKEIYLRDKLGNTRKIILTEKGFINKNEEIKQGHRYFVGDFNLDGKYEYFDMSQSTGKGWLTTYKY